MCDGDIRSGIERDAAELLIVELRNRFLLGAGFAQNADAPCRPPRLRVQGRGGPIPILTHSRPPVFPNMRQHILRSKGISTCVVTVCRSGTPAIFDV